MIGIGSVNGGRPGERLGRPCARAFTMIAGQARGMPEKSPDLGG